MAIVMDGVSYNVRAEYDTIQRSFEIMEGQNGGQAITLRQIRDIIGTGYSYTLKVLPVPSDRASYDAFYEAISKPVDSHTITMPYGQTTITFEAYVTSGSDDYHGKMGGNWWSGLTVNFYAMEPQRTE